VRSLDGGSCVGNDLRDRPALPPGAGCERCSSGVVAWRSRAWFRVRCGRLISR